MKILIAEDERLTRTMLRKYLENLGYEVLEAEDGAQAYEIYNREQINFLITDWMMPVMNGLELLKKIRTEDRHGYTYIIFLTSKEEKDEMIEAISHGADDYIRKPFDKGELSVRVRAGQRIVDLQEKLAKLAETDPLTGLWNRRGLVKLIEQHPEYRTGQTKTPAAFVMADIDHFKQINDAFGHEVGDFVLKWLSALLQTAYENCGTVSRVGGEEFFIVLRGANASVAEQLSENARKMIEQAPYQVPDGKTIGITCSFGVYCVKAGEVWDLTESMKRADQALYLSKNRGRNRVTVSC